MKRSILSLSLMLAMNIAGAETYLGIYKVNAQGSTSSGAELHYKESKASAVFGARTAGDTALGGEVIFGTHGIGGSFGFHQVVGAVTLSLGKIVVLDKSTGQTDLGIAETSAHAYGNYVGLQYKIFSLRIVDYDVNSIYTKRVDITTPEDELPVIISNTTYSSASRRQLWLGIQYDF